MSISLNGTSYDLTYVGIGNDFVEQPGATLTVDAWGMDRLTRRYSGRLDKVATERNKYKRDRKKRDSIYPWLYVTDYTLTESAPFAELVVNYRGIFDGKIPQPVIEDSGERRQSVQLGLAGDAELTEVSGTCNVTYAAPYVRVNFVSEKKPKAPKHYGLLEVGQLSVLKQTGAHRGELRLVRGFSLGAPAGTKLQALVAEVGKFNGTIEIHSELHGVKKAGQWWVGSETHEVVIVPMEQRRIVYKIAA